MTNKEPVKVSTSSMKSLCHILLKDGFSLELIESTLGMSVEELEQSDQKIPISRIDNMWSLAIEHKQDPALGLKIGRRSLPDDMGLVGHIFFNNATLGKALAQYQRYYSLVNEGMHIELREFDDLASLCYVSDQQEAYCIPDMDRTISVAIHRAKNFLNTELDIEYIGFQHAAPVYKNIYDDVFPCPVEFSTEHTTIVFKKHYLDYALPKRSAYLHKVLTHHIENLLSKVRPKISLTEKVRKLISDRLAKASIDADHIAEKLCMSRHTMYRHLKQEGYSFHEIVDKVREEKALSYLRQDKYTLNEVAFLLGFSELSAFSRAFKRWTGSTPAKYKKTLNKKP